MTDGPAIKVLQECGFKDESEFDKRGQYALAILKEVKALRENAVLLELGCAGHIAAAIEPHSAGMQYHGIGIHGGMLKWCGDTFQKGFSFQRIDVRDAIRNPMGAVIAEKIRLPFDDESIDTVYAESLFTTMPQEAIRRYISEIARVLKAGGKFVGTFFLLDGGSMIRISQRRSRYSFENRVDTYCRAQTKLPGTALAYNDSFIRMLGAPVHLEVKEMRSGSWSGLADAPAFEDLVIAEKLKVEEPAPEATATKTAEAPPAPKPSTSAAVTPAPAPVVPQPAPAAPQAAPAPPAQDANAAK